MADSTMNSKSTLPPDEVIIRAIQFFSGEKFKATSQSPRTVTFEGKPPIPWGMLFFTIIGFIFAVIPGIIMYIMLFRKMYRFHSLVVTVSPAQAGSEVSITSPKWAKKLANRFLTALPSESVAA